MILKYCDPVRWTPKENEDPTSRHSTFDFQTTHICFREEDLPWTYNYKKELRLLNTFRDESKKNKKVVLQRLIIWVNRHTGKSNLIVRMLRNYVTFKRLREFF